MSERVSRLLSEKSRNLLANLNRVMSANLIIGVSNLLSGIWFARFLGPRIVGDYAVVLIAIGLLTAFLVPGFNLAVIREPLRKEIVAAATFATLLQSLIVVLTSSLIYILSYWYDQAAVSELCFPGALMLASLVLSFWMYLLAAPFEAEMNYQFLAKVRLLALGVSVVIGVIAAEMGLGIYALVIRDLFASATTLVLVGIHSPLQLTCQGWREGINGLLSFVRGIWGLNLLERLVLRLDYALVGVLLEKDALGIYFAVRGLIEGGLGFVVVPVQTIIYSFYCRADDLSVIVKALLSKGLLLLAGVTAFAVVGAYAMGPLLVSTLLGHGYQEGASLLWGLVLYAFAVGWFENIKVLAMARNCHNSMLVPKAIQLIASLVMTYPLIQLAGLAGAGTSAGFGAVGTAALATWVVSRWPADAAEKIVTLKAVSHNPAKILL